MFDGHPLISVDGTGYHSSHSVSCRNCCGREHRDGTGTYHHQALGASIVHPDIGEVPPLAPEPIRRGDGSTKNDCGRNAGRRLIGDLRREHPHMKAIIAGDGLSSNGPHSRLLKEKDPPFILGGRPGDHELLSAGPGPANPDRHGRGATGEPARCTASSGTTACRPPTRIST